jgi:glycine/D-amino acid oxidase-like deaminating enzyme
MRSLRLAATSAIDADAFVFACGPWLGQVFSDVLGSKIRPTRQEVFFFGTPPGDRFGDTQLPVWIEHGAHLFYGIPGNRYRGFKVADDTQGAVVDPTTMERIPSAAAVADARALLARRFPELKSAPLVEARVCQYENSPDSNFIIDRHPSLSNVWIAGGGSGHGFKFGPALGERIAAVVLGERRPDPLFTLARFK